MENRIWRLEALRGLAAIYVVLSHTLPHKMMFFGFNAGYLVRFGQEAVILFFLLSGFVINYSYCNASTRADFRTYFARRFARIYIPLLLVYVVSYFTVVYNEGGFFLPDLKSFLGNLFMLQDWGNVKPNVIVEPFLGNDPLWSLSYEWWFYMAYFPLIRYIGTDSARNNLVFLISGLATVLYFFFPEFLPRIAMYFGIWWVGVFLSQLYMNQKKPSIEHLYRPLFFLTFALVVLAVKILYVRMQGGGLLFGMHPVLEFRHFLFAFVAVIAAVVWSARNWMYFDVLVKPFSIFAPASYVIYICHFHLFREATYLDFIEFSPLRWVGYFAVVLLFSYAVEVKLYPRLRRPLMKFMLRT